MNIEPFIYLVIFLLFALITLGLRWLRGEIGNGAELEEGVTPLDLSQERPSRPAPVSATSQPSGGREGNESTLTLARHEGKSRQVRMPPTNLQEIRRGIVLMTVLGPCRALEPPYDSFYL